MLFTAEWLSRERAHDAPNLEKCEPTIKSMVSFDGWFEGSQEAASLFDAAHGQLP